MRDRPDCHSNPLLPSKLPKVAIPSYLHPISPAVGEMDKEKKGRLPAKTRRSANAPRRRPEGRFSPPRGISLSWPLTPPIPKRNPNRIFSPHAAHLFFCCLGPAAGLTYARRRGGGGRGVAGPGARLNLRLKRVPTTSTTYTQAKQRTTPSQPLPTTHQSPGSHKHGVANRGQLIRWPQYIYSRG